MVSFGYLGGHISTKKHQNRIDKHYTIKENFSFFVIGSSLFGLFIVIWLVLRVHQVSVFGYLKMFLNFDSAIFLKREEILKTKEVSGIIKMFNVLPLAMFLLVKSLSFNLNFDKRSANKLHRLEFITLTILISKTFFTLDRLSILAIVTSYSYQFLKTKKILSIKALVTLAILILLGNRLSTSRLEDVNLFDFLILYFKSGIINFQILLDTYNNYTLGFNTFFSPLSFILKFLGIPMFSGVNYEWYWNPAQYFTSYLFMDFQYGSILIYFLLGIFFKHIDNKVRNQSQLYSSIYFLLLFTVSSFMVVPFLRGMEFWLAIIWIFLTTKFFIKNETIL
jgi:hypothetical protein